MRRFATILVSLVSLISVGVMPASAAFDDRTPDASVTIYFSPLGAALTSSAKAELRAFYGEQPTDTTYGVVGYVQRGGSSSNNIPLSKARERSTRAFLLGLGATDVSLYGGKGVYVKSPTSQAARRVTVFAYHPAPEPEPQPVVYTVTYDANGGVVAPTSATFTVGGAALSLPGPDARTGYRFDGWFTAATGGTSVGGFGAAYSPTASVTLFAHWTLLPYTVAFDANGGDTSTLAPMMFTPGDPALVLPAPLFGPGDFDGWFTAPTGGTRVAYGRGLYTPTGSILLYARWVVPTTSNTTIEVTIDWLFSSEGGYGTIDGCADGCPVDITPNGEGPDYLRTFQVPVGGVFTITLQEPWYELWDYDGASCNVVNDWDMYTTTVTCSAFSPGVPAWVRIWAML